MLFQDILKRPIELILVGYRDIPYKEVFHFHRDIEIYFIHAGVGQVILDQQIHEIKSGSLLFFRPYQPHYQQMEITATQPFSGSSIRYNPSYFAEYLRPFPKLDKFHQYLLHSDHIMQIQHHLQPDQLDLFIKDFAQRFKSQPTHDPLERNAIFLLSFFHFIQPLWEYSEPNTHNTTTHLFIIDVLKWIDQHYAQEFRLEALAQNVHLSPNHVSYLFHKTTGKTITDFLIVRRLKQASFLLLTTSLSIQEIGERAGYPNFPYFCQVFKKNMGMSPAQFRAQG